jgi:hypothetical protein
LSSGEKAAAKKKKHQENIALANPQLALENKEKNEAKRKRREETGSTKSFK